MNLRRQPKFSDRIICQCVNYTIENCFILTLPCQEQSGNKETLERWLYCPIVMRLSFHSTNWTNFCCFPYQFFELSSLLHKLGYHLTKNLISSENPKAREGLNIFVRGKFREMKSLMDVGKLHYTDLILQRSLVQTEEKHVHFLALAPV